jgi:hypothetical protein
MDEPEYEPDDEGGFRRIWKENICMIM